MLDFGLARQFTNSSQEVRPVSCGFSVMLKYVSKENIQLLYVIN